MDITAIVPIPSKLERSIVRSEDCWRTGPTSLGVHRQVAVVDLQGQRADGGGEDPAAVLVDPAAVRVPGAVLVARRRCSAAAGPCTGC